MPRSRKTIERMFKQGLPIVQGPVGFAPVETAKPRQVIEIGEPVAWVDPSVIVEIPTPEMVARIVAERMGL